jgi:predicted dehydrogenase
MKRIGVIGLGKVAQLHHLPAIQARHDADIAAVCDWSPRLVGEVGRQYGVRLQTTVAAQVLAADIDGVMICNRDHADLVLAAIDAGIPVFVEKPICWTLSQARQIAKAAGESGRRLMVGYMKLADPAVAALRNWAATADLQLVQVINRAGGRHHFERLHQVAKPEDATGPQRQSELSGIERAVADQLGSAEPELLRSYFTLLELASHDLNLVRTIVGCGQLDVQYARQTHRSRTDVLEVGLNAAGIPVTLACLPSFSSARSWDESLTAYVADGSAELRFPSPFRREAATALTVREADRASERTTRSTFTYLSSYRLQLERFCQLIECGEADICSAADAVRDVELVDQITTLLAAR